MKSTTKIFLETDGDGGMDAPGGETAWKELNIEDGILCGSSSSVDTLLIVR